MVNQILQIYEDVNDLNSREKVRLDKIKYKKCFIS